MSSEVWNIAQNVDANTMYENSSYYMGVFRMGKNELLGLQKITSMCVEMTATFNEVVQDQNNYVIEFENLEMAYSQEQNDISAQIKQLIAEIKALEVKAQEGNLSEDEQKELDAKKGQLNSLYNASVENSADRKAQLAENKAAIKDKYSKKEKIASDYGNLAVEKGNDFLDEEISKKEKEAEKEGGKLNLNLFKIVFNGKLEKHLNGKTAIAAGEGLLDKVEESALVDKKISSKKIK